MHFNLGSIRGRKAGNITVKRLEAQSTSGTQASSEEVPQMASNDTDAQTHKHSDTDAQTHKHRRSTPARTLSVKSAWQSHHETQEHQQSERERQSSHKAMVERTCNEKVRHRDRVQDGTKAVMPLAGQGITKDRKTSND